MDKYYYQGPVMMFDRCIANEWYGETTAVSESKAKSNLIYRFKKENNLLPNTKISFPGKIKIKERDIYGRV